MTGRRNLTKKHKYKPETLKNASKAWGTGESLSDGHVTTGRKRLPTQTYKTRMDPERQEMIKEEH